MLGWGAVILGILILFALLLVAAGTHSGMPMNTP